MSANFVDVMLIDADTVSFLLTVFPELAARVARRGRSCCRCSCCSGGSIRFGCGCGRPRSARSVCLAALSGAVVRGADGPREGVRVDRLRVAVRALRRARAVRSRDARPSRIRQRRPRSPVVGRARGLQAGAAAAAHRPRARRVELRHQRACRASRCRAGYQSHFRSFDGKERTFLVEGAGGPTWYTEYNVLSGLVGALLRPFRRVRDADRRRAASRAACRTRCTTAAIAPTASIPGSALFSARAISRRRSASITSTTPRTSRPATIEPDEFYYAFTADLLKRDHAQGPMFVFTYLMANHFPWTYRYRDELSAGLARPRQRRRERPPHRRISAPPGHERARLQGVRRAAQARFPGRAVPDRALRRSPADVRQNVVDPASTTPRSAAASTPPIRVSSPPTTPSTR